MPVWALAGIAERVAQPLGLDPLAAAHGIVAIAIAKMSLAVREVSVAKGYDPRDFVLIASGGAGPLHAAAIARELHIPQVIVPRFPGHFSAVGMLLTDQRHDLVQTIYARLDQLDTDRTRATYDRMAGRLGELIDAERLRIEAFLDMRYAGQDFTLPVPVDRQDLADDGLRRIRRRFDEVHQRRYGHSAPDERAEVVNLRVTGLGRRERPDLVDAPRPGNASPAPDRALVHFEAGGEPVSAPIFAREGLAPGYELEGPALVEEYASTTVLFAGDRVTVADSLELVIDVHGPHA